MDASKPFPRCRTRPVLVLATGLVLLGLFAWLAVGVKQRSLLVATDEICGDVLFIHATNSPVVAAAFKFVTELASQRALWGEGAAILLLLLGLRKWRAALVWVLAFAGNGMVMLLKTWVDRPRPVVDNPLDIGPSASFPSGHAAGAAIVFGMLAYFSMRARPRRWLSFVTLFGSLIVLIGFSRVYLGAHWLSDVIGGWIFGLGWVLLCVGVAGLTSREPSKP